MMKTIALATLAAGLVSLSLPAAPADTPARVKPINLPVNTKADEDDPFVSSSGLALYYTSNAEGKFDVMIAQRRSPRQAWGKGRLLEDYVMTEADDRGVYVTNDRSFPQFLYYATKKDKKADANFDLYVCVKQAAGKAFAAPTPLNKVDTEADEMHPWLTADGKQLYFSRKTKEGWRVFVTSRPRTTGPQGWGDPKLVEDIPANYYHACLTPDGRTMYLQGPLDKGRWGLFTATKTRTGWSKPQPLEQLNDPEAPTGDRSPCVSRDGALFYFASDRAGGKGGLDLWVVPMAKLKAKK